MKNKVFNKITSAFGKMGLKLKVHSPEILVITGVVGLVGAAVAACTATTKVSKIVDEREKQLDEVAHAKSMQPDEYSDDDARRDEIIINAKTALKFARVYAPAFAIATASIVMIFAGQNILKKRSAALAAAYAAVENGFKEYRARVAERFGGDVEKELAYAVKAKQLTEKVVDEKGKEKEVKKTVNVAEKSLGGNPYAMIFDENCELWTQDDTYNHMTLRAEQQYANDYLRTRGYVFLNDIFERIGCPKTKMGQVVGWVYDSNNDEGDNFVDFGIQDINVDGEEKIILEFNPQGNILDIFGGKSK